MPSQKTAEKPVKIELIKVKAKRAFAIDYSLVELKEMQKNDKENRSFKGMTRLINPDEVVDIDKETAKKLQKAGVVQIEL